VGKLFGCGINLSVSRDSKEQKSEKPWLIGDQRRLRVKNLKPYANRFCEAWGCTERGLPFFGETAVLAKSCQEAAEADFAPSQCKQSKYKVIKHVPFTLSKLLCWK
jgi:hypothetical protein